MTSTENTIRGERHLSAKLTDQLVLAARQDHDEGMGYVELAVKYGVTKATIWKAVNGATWSHLEERST